MPNLLAKGRTALNALLTRSIEINCDLIPYRFERVPLKKLLNWLRVEASIYVRPEVPWGWPTHYMIEPTTRCNLRCALCPVTQGLHRPAGDFDPAVFKKLIDEVGDYIFLLLMWDWGEPFLNPGIYDMIAYARTKGIKCVSSTNGHMFAQPDNADKVIRSGLDTLIVAMDGVTQESYARYRQGGRLEMVQQAVRTLVDRKRALNSSLPFINLRFVLMKQNEDEILELKALARSLGVDALTLKTLNPYYENEAEMTADPDEFVPTEARYRRFAYTDPGRQRIRVRRNPCKTLWNHPAIHWNGTVCPCTFDEKEQLGMGNLREQTFAEIWHGAKYREMRRRFRTAWEQLSPCANCSYAYEGGNCATDIVAEATFFQPGGADRVVVREG
jgi:radical SAM protein with 4Fe4S-binding SPASM domain